MKPLPPNAQTAISLLRDRLARIYLGASYGLTPHTKVSPEKVDLFFGARAEKEHYEPLCDVASELAQEVGKEALHSTFTDKYSDLETAPDTLESLRLLRPLATGKILVTGSYSTKIVSSFERLTTAFNESGVKSIRPDSDSRNVSLVMLHGWQGSPSSLLLTREDVDSFDSGQEGISKLVKGLLLSEKPWIVLGSKKSEDLTFARLCAEACAQISGLQRPIYVVDPREPEAVARQWPRGALRHVQMTADEFLMAASAQFAKSNPELAPPSPPKGQPPAPPGPPSDHDFVDETPDPPGDIQPSQNSGDNGGKETTSAPPPDAPGPNSPRQLRIRSLDGRAFRTTADGDMRVSVLASRFIQQDTGNENASGRRAVVDRLGASGQRSRCNGHDTLAEAGIEDGDELCIYTDTVAGAMDPKRHEAYLNDVQQQLENLTRQDARISVKPNLPQASDRYEVLLRCGGWGPPEDSAMRPIRTFEQKVRIDYPAEAPNAPPAVRWISEIYHPNVKPKTGYVCLGALNESFTPLFGPQELVRMLIELSEYRNFELDGVLNREAAIWAQLNPDIIVAHGGWAYQPTLEEKRDDETETQLSFEPQPTGVGLRRRRKS